MSSSGSDWRVIDGVTTAWFDAPSLVAGAVLAERALASSPEARIELRDRGVRIRVDAADEAGTVSEAARGLGLTAEPGRLQQLGVVFESANPTGVSTFWQRVTGYDAVAPATLTDPLGRGPTLRIRPSRERRTERHRIHLDVVRPEAVVEEVRPGEPSGPYGVCHRDPDGNEVDLVPGGSLGEQPETDDWREVFAAVACYRVRSTREQVALATAAARLADDVGFPLLVDLRPGLVVLDSGKDRWDPGAHGLDVDFDALAVVLQAAARGLGAVADPTAPRFVQLFLDAADVAAVRACWVAALSYVEDRRAHTTDIVDPDRLGPEVVFQQIDLAETGRRTQRNRIHVELAVPSDAAAARVETVLAVGGRLLEQAGARWRLADPEGNEIVVVAG
ncbi:hypothetical protein GCM10023258_36230 [Terrabacter aeriphilus]|uniref:Glyoxalase-like domain-containing protein n=1 Tax=Terrabacter aeriphilus TaxID=515662 RepID=A0ABP9JMX3_9MICO